jgi:cell division protein FtsI/penicillin-binding protein 2
MAIGIDSNKFTPETTVYDSGSLTLNGKTIQNWDKKAHGKVTMTQVIEDSINVGAVYAQMKIGRQIFLNYLKQFGFDSLTGIDLPGEIKGSLKSLTNPNAPDINYATASFGQ